MPDRLFCSDADRARIIERQADRIGAALHRRLQAVVTAVNPDADDLDGLEAGFAAAGYAMIGWLETDATAADRYAQHAAAMAHDVIGDRWPHHSNHTGDDGAVLWNGDYKMIMRSDPAVGVAMALAFAGDRWPTDTQNQIAEALLIQAERLIAGGGRGWTDSPVSNWTANTRAAAGLCALALDGYADPERVAAVLDAAQDGVAAFLATGGERGWHQESWHYYRYALGHHLLPFACAWAHRCDDQRWHDGPLGWTPLLYPFVRVGKSAVLPHRERPLEATHFHSGELLMGAGVAPAASRPALAWELIERCGDSGPASDGGDGSWDVRYAHHALLGLLHVPALDAHPGTGNSDGDSTSSHDPRAELLGHHWVDDTKGLYGMRHRFGNGGSCWVDANRAAKPGTGRPSCAGAFTLSAHGHVWAHGARIGKPVRSAYSCCHSPGQDVHAGATTTAWQPSGQGDARLTLDLIAVHPDCGHATRDVALAWQPNGDVELTLHDDLGAVVDWTWHGDGQPDSTDDGWRVVMPDGCQLMVTVNAGDHLTFDTSATGYTARLRGAAISVCACVTGPGRLTASNFADRSHC